MISIVLPRIAEELRKEIELHLNSIGLLCRVFGRGKTTHSINTKISSNPNKYSMAGKLIQDSVGIRVVVYFPDDVDIVDGLLRKKYRCDDSASSIDRPQKEVFSVTRHNLIFSLPDSNSSQLKPLQAQSPVDSTFEVQLRTILSEGWHEIEHDLRYKRKSDWVTHDDLSRHLNGVVATLETAEWSAKKIFDDLAYRHYKNRSFDAMLHSVFRMRISSKLSDDLSDLFNAEPSIGKELLRVSRKEVFGALARLAPKIPITVDNLVFLWNHCALLDPKIKSITPQVLVENFSENL
jgi:ppGpp synthetase/RelA/SpoT-type nucleotidyltranferase